MGRMVQLWKLRESSEEVDYLYGSSREEAGLLRASKHDGTVEKVRAVKGLGESDDNFFYFQLASVKIAMLRETGEFPEETFIGT
jgi:hypothetical protein